MLVGLEEQLKPDMHGTDRVMHEVLVAKSDISGDAADDTELPDS